MTTTDDDLSEVDIDTIRRNQCPACSNWGFIAGPRGGAGQNIYCANPKCRAAYMVAPRHDIMWGMRVGQAEDRYYPPKVHILSNGMPLCGFAGVMTIDNGPPPRMVVVLPDAWPIGHSWVVREDFEQCTCAACRERARS